MKITLSSGNTFTIQETNDLETLAESIVHPDESVLVDFMRKWWSDQKVFDFQTSGSTGDPKTIQLSRELLVHSARQTLDALKLHSDNTNYHLLLCISPKFIGGAMVFVRAWLLDCHLKVLPPTTDFHPIKENLDLTSLVPLQVEKLLSNPHLIPRFKSVLIGGAPIAPHLEFQIMDLLGNDHNWYATYGMTETASHIALRKLGKDHFEATGDVQFELDDRNCLQIIGSITQNKPLLTNDIVELIDSKKFRWKGRHDLVINTGGVKVHPEKVEAELIKCMAHDELVVTWVPDATLGQKVVCLSNKDYPEQAMDLTSIDRYERPKLFGTVSSIPKTATHKIDRLKAQLLAQKLFN